MRRRWKTEAKTEMEEEERRKSVVFVSSSDDEEANGDLSLEIVEKARKREVKRKKQESLREFDRKSVRSDTIVDTSSMSPSDVAEGVAEGLSHETVMNAKTREAKRKREEVLRGSERKSFVEDAVIDLSSLSSSDGAELIAEGEDLKKKKKKIKKKVKSKKKKEKVFEEDDKFVNNVNAEESLVTVEAGRTDGVEMFNNDMKTEESLLVVEDVNVEVNGLSGDVMKAEESLEAIESIIPEAIGTSDNVVLRKLLRGPRYFDPPDSHWGACYNCGKEGHTIANCTEEKRKKPCFVCGKFGHGAKHCTQGHYCYICKGRGHIAKNCSEKHQESSQSSKICLRCGELGHDMSSCSNDYAPEDIKEIQCYICKSFGHLCCANVLDNGPREVSCYNCGQSGHTGLGCAKSRRETSSVASPTVCYKCGEEGHFARGCNKSAKSGRWIGEQSTLSRDSGFRSVPHDVGKIHKKKTTPNGGKKFMTTGKSKQRGGWIVDDPGDLHNRNGKSKQRGGWITDDPGDFPNRNGKSWQRGGWIADDSGDMPKRNWKPWQRASWMTDDPGDISSREGKANGSPATPWRKGQTSGGHLLSSQSPLRKHNILFETPSPHVSPKPPRHKFSASRFGNNNSHFGRRYDY